MKDELFDINNNIIKELINRYNNIYDVLPNIGNYIEEVGGLLGYSKFRDNVWIGSNSNIDSNVTIIGPCIIGNNVTVRSNAYIRGNVIIGNDVVVGNCSEVKNSILMDGVSIPHFNYVGNSILGNNAHLGAGVILSNQKSDKSIINNTKYNKLGALIGDNVEIGCNSVLNPGTVVGKNTTIYPLSMIRGTIKKNVIVKHSQDQVIIVKKH